MTPIGDFLRIWEVKRPVRTVIAIMGFRYGQVHGTVLLAEDPAYLGQWRHGRPSEDGLRAIWLPTGNALVLRVGETIVLLRGGQEVKRFFSEAEALDDVDGKEILELFRQREADVLKLARSVVTPVKKEAVAIARRMIAQKQLLTRENIIARINARRAANEAAVSGMYREALRGQAPH